MPRTWHPVRISSTFAQCLVWSPVLRFCALRSAGTHRQPPLICVITTTLTPLDPFPSTLPGCFINADLLCIWPAMSGAPTRQVQCLIITAAGGGEIHALDPCNYMHRSTGSHGNTGSCTSRVYELLRGANKAAAPFPNASAELPNMLCSWPACLQRSKVANHRFLTVRGLTLELPVS